MSAYILYNKVSRLRREINRLLSNGMPNIYLNITIEKHWHSQNFDLLSLKDLSSDQFFEEFQIMHIPLNCKTSCCNLKIGDLGAKLCVTFLSF